MRSAHRHDSVTQVFHLQVDDTVVIPLPESAAQLTVGSGRMTDE